MDKIKIAQAIQIIKKKKAKSSYYDYVKFTHDDYMYNKHGEYISNVIDEAIVKRDSMLRGDISVEAQYIMLSVPPRHGKSMHISETLPSYVMGKYSKFKVIMTAYSSTLAHDFAKSNSNKYKERNIFNVKVVADNQDRMTLDNGSEMIKAGILGGITGKGAHLLIIDDPIKTSEEAMSKVQRDKIWKEWVSSLSTRLELAPIVIVIMTRWHEDDLCGRLLNVEYGEPLPWKVINLPLEAEENDLLGREVGAPLWPERYGKDFIEIRKRYPKDFNALYQGRPTSDEGNMIKREWWNYYDEMPKHFDQVIQSWDCTFKESDGSDYVVGTVWGRVGPDKYLLDLVRERMDLPKTLVAIQVMTNKWPIARAKLIEDKANGPAVMQMLRHKIPGMIPINPRGSKIARVQAVLPHIEGGNVYIPRLSSYTNSFVEECASFPNGKHDDMVDSMTQALDRLINEYTVEQKQQKLPNFMYNSDNNTGGASLW